MLTQVQVDSLLLWGKELRQTESLLRNRLQEMQESQQFRLQGKLPQLPTPIQDHDRIFQQIGLGTPPSSYPSSES